MSTVLYTIAVIFAIIWLIGFFGFQLGGMLHFLLAASLITVVVRILSGDGSDTDLI